MDWNVVLAISSVVSTAIIAFGLIVSWFQLRAFLRVERVKALVQLEAEFDMDTWIRLSNKFMFGNNFAKSRKDNENAMATFDFKKPDDQTWMNDFLRICNFFERAGLFYQGRVIDRSMYMDDLATLTVEFYLVLHDAIVTYGKRHKHYFDRFRMLALAAEAYYQHKSHGRSPFKDNRVSDLPLHSHSAITTGAAH